MLTSNTGEPSKTQRINLRFHWIEILKAITCHMLSLLANVENNRLKPQREKRVAFTGNEINNY